MNSVMSDSELSQKMWEIFDWGFDQCGLEIDFTVRELKDESLEWIYKIFPEDPEEEEEYLANGNQEELKVKFVMMHCLMVFWHMFNHPEVDYRKYVFEKVMRGKEEGWVGCENANDDLNPNGNPVRDIDYFMKFDNGMFVCVGI